MSSIKLTNQSKIGVGRENLLEFDRAQSTYICETFKLFRPKKTFTAAISYSHLPLDQLIANKKYFLSPKEESCFNQLKHIKRQHSYLLGRFTAKQAISKLVPTIEPHQINIEWGVFNQPVIQHQHIHNLQVSITHTKNCALSLAFPEHHPMGIDLEDCSRGSMKAINSQVSSDEMQILEKLAIGRRQSLVLLWSIKEALSKLLKTGLMANFSLYAIASSQTNQEIIISSFKNFHQYQAISTIFNNQILSIVLPKKTTTNLEIVLNKMGSYADNIH